jgi:hypothetical protein
MADYFYGELEVCGNITMDDVENINDIATTQGYRINNSQWLGTEFDLAELIKNEGTLTFSDDQARYGELVPLEAYLKEHSIPFIASSEAKYGYDAIIRYHLGYGEEYELITDSTLSQPYVLASELEEVVKMMKEENCDGAIEKAECMLPPEMPPLKITNY